MKKPTNQPRRITSLIPGGDASVLMDTERLKEQMAGLEPKKRQRLVAFLCGIHHTRKLADMLGLKRSYIDYCCNQHRDVMEASQLGRNFSIADLAERKTIEVLANINADGLSNDKRPQAAKYLMEVAELANVQTKPKEEKDDGNTMELIFKIKQKMSIPKQVEDNVPLDITDQVTVEDVKDE